MMIEPVMSKPALSLEISFLLRRTAKRVIRPILICKTNARYEGNDKLSKVALSETPGTVVVRLVYQALPQIIRLPKTTAPVIPPKISTLRFVHVRRRYKPKT